MPGLLRSVAWSAPLFTKYEVQWFSRDASNTMTADCYITYQSSKSSKPSKPDTYCLSWKLWSCHKLISCIVEEQYSHFVVAYAHVREIIPITSFYQYEQLYFCMTCKPYSLLRTAWRSPNSVNMMCTGHRAYLRFAIFIVYYSQETPLLLQEVPLFCTTRLVYKLCRKCSSDIYHLPFEVQRDYVSECRVCESDV